MKVQCPTCNAIYKIGETKITDKAVYGTCAKCKSRFIVKKSDINQKQSNESSEPTKACPFCAEEIKADAIKCRYCGEWIEQTAAKAPNHLNRIEEPIPEIINSETDIKNYPSEYIYEEEDVEEYPSEFIYDDNDLVENKTSQITAQNNELENERNLKNIEIGRALAKNNPNFFKGLFKAFSIVISLCIFLIAGVIANQKTSPSSSINLDEIANEINKKCPIMVDSETRLENSIGIGKVFAYNYTLINYSSDQIDAFAFRKEREALIRKRVCTTKELKIFIKKGVTVKYRYYGNNGGHIADIAVFPGDCTE